MAAVQTVSDGARFHMVEWAAPWCKGHGPVTIRSRVAPASLPWATGAREAVLLPLLEPGCETGRRTAPASRAEGDARRAGGGTSASGARQLISSTTVTLWGEPEGAARRC